MKIGSVLLASLLMTGGAEAGSIQCNLKHTNGEIWSVAKYETQGDDRVFTLLSRYDGGVFKPSFSVVIPATAVTKVPESRTELSSFTYETFAEQLVVDWERNFLARVQYWSAFAPARRVTVQSETECVQMQ